MCDLWAGSRGHETRARLAPRPDHSLNGTLALMSLDQPSDTPRILPASQVASVINRKISQLAPSAGHDVGCRVASGVLSIRDLTGAEFHVKPSHGPVLSPSRPLIPNDQPASGATRAVLPKYSRAWDERGGEGVAAWLEPSHLRHASSDCVNITRCCPVGPLHSPLKHREMLRIITPSVMGFCSARWRLVRKSRTQVRFRSLPQHVRPHSPPRTRAISGPGRAPGTSR